MSRDRQVGFSQRIRLEWLEYAAGLVLVGNDKAQVEEALQAHLRDKLSVGGNALRGTREKAITILMKIWALPPKRLSSFRDEGLGFLRRLPPSKHTPLHWCMSMAVYPFWGAVAETTGRLLRLQGIVTASQVQRRLRERYGERQTVARAARRVLRAFHDWGVLRESGEKGAYVVASAQKIGGKALLAWMIEAVLRASGNRSGDLNTLATSASLFPFIMPSVRVADLRARQPIEVMHHAAGDTVSLRC